MLEKIFAAVVFLACVALLARLLADAPRRRRIDAFAHRTWQRGRQALRRSWSWRRERRQAEREAEEAIRRAQRRAGRDGNVIRPDAFKGPRKPH